VEDHTRAIINDVGKSRKRKQDPEPSTLPENLNGTILNREGNNDRRATMSAVIVAPWKAPKTTKTHLGRASTGGIRSNNQQGLNENTDDENRVEEALPYPHPSSASTANVVHEKTQRKVKRRQNRD